jgi:F0F1-type ATP synthase assembly protein I
LVGCGSRAGKGFPIKDEDHSASEGIAASYRKAQPYLAASWLLTGSVALGVLVGYLADGWLHTKPWLLLAGSVLGMASGLTGFIRAVLELQRHPPRE